jgi:membrane associated rhomboid family serine protease
MSNFRYTRPDSFPPIVKNLIIINVIVWIAQLVLDKQFNLTDKLALYPIMPEQLRQMLIDSHVQGYAEGNHFMPYQIATHMFTHAPFPMVYHIFFNMFALYMFGKALENVWGGKRFLLFYLVCGVGAAAVHLLISYLRCEQLLHLVVSDPSNPAISKLVGATASVVGASGAIMGVLAAFGYLFPNTELMMMMVPFPIKAKWMVIGMAALDVFGGFSGGDNVAHFAHLGGALTGFILVLIWNRNNRRTFY